MGAPSAPVGFMGCLFQLRGWREAVPFEAEPGRYPLALTCGKGVERIIGVALLMTHSFWDQPCPLGSTFQEGPQLAPCADVQASAKPCPDQEKASQPPARRGASLVGRYPFLDGELPGALLAM